MKQILSIVLALMLLLGLAACGMGNSTDESSVPENAGTEGAQPVTEGTQPFTEAPKPGTEAPADSDNQGGRTEQAMVPGNLNYVNQQEGEEPALRGLRLSGNRVGDTINKREPAAEGIRSIFALNEWVEFYPDTDADNLKVWILRHDENRPGYETGSLSEQTLGYMQSLDLNRDPDGDTQADWGSFYLNPEDAEPGYYDFVFTIDDVPVATLLTRFYPESELEEKTDDELEAIMTGLATPAN